MTHFDYLSVGSHNNPKQHRSRGTKRHQDESLETDKEELFGFIWGPRLNLDVHSRVVLGYNPQYLEKCVRIIQKRKLPLLFLF